VRRERRPRVVERVPTRRAAVSLMVVVVVVSKGGLLGLICDMVDGFVGCFGVLDLLGKGGYVDVCMYAAAAAAAGPEVIDSWSFRSNR
jgi:hypothetical protein